MGIKHVTADNKKLLDDIEQTLNKAKRIVAITGAGISTNCGIPDFRSKEGLYSLINSDYNKKAGAKASSGHIKGKDLFSSTVWQDEDSTSVFYTFIASLRQKIKEEIKNTSQTHKFIRRIRDNKKLLRCYTQNIDGLESRVGLTSDMDRGKGTRGRFTKKAMDLPHYHLHNNASGKLDGGCEVVQLHGDLETVRCNICQRVSQWAKPVQPLFLQGIAPPCQECETEDAIRKAAGKRGSAVGTLRPNIVLYGEANPMESEIGTILSHDLTFGADLLIIMGTSLKVHGLKTIVKEFAKAVHSKRGKVIFVNLSEPATSTWKDVIDFWIEMDCDTWAVDQMRSRQTEIAFSTKKKGIVAEIDKENVPSTPTTNRIQSKLGLPTPPSTIKRKRPLGELDPVSAVQHHTSKKPRLDASQRMMSPPSLDKGRKKTASEFKIWENDENEEGKKDATFLPQPSAEAILTESSPSKNKKRKRMPLGG